VQNYRDQPESMNAIAPDRLITFTGMRTRSYNHLRCTLGRLFAYLVEQDKLARTPVQSPPRRSRYQRTPFIFDIADAKRLLSVAKTLADKRRDG
jgi:site-specific recombinase XerC